MVHFTLNESIHTSLIFLIKIIIFYQDYSIPKRDLCGAVKYEEWREGGEETGGVVAIIEHVGGYRPEPL